MINYEREKKSNEKTLDKTYSLHFMFPPIPLYPNVLYYLSFSTPSIIHPLTSENLREPIPPYIDRVAW